MRIIKEEDVKRLGFERESARCGKNRLTGKASNTLD